MSTLSIDENFKHARRHIRGELQGKTLPYVLPASHEKSLETFLELPLGVEVVVSN